MLLNQSLKNTFKVLFLVLFATQFSASVFAQKKKVKELDGRIYNIDLEELKEGKSSKSVPDEFYFKSGKLNSDILEEKGGFDPADYTITSDTSYIEDEQEIKITTFEAVSKNENEEDLKWTGTITNYEIEGSAVWSKKEKIKKQYSFTGSLKPNKK